MRIIIGIIIAGLLAWIAVHAFPAEAHAEEESKIREFSELTVEVVSRERILKKHCNYNERYGTLNGCYIKSEDKMYIRSNMDLPEFVMVYFHEVGHFYTEPYKSREMRMFREGNDITRENVAEDFALYMTAPYLLTPEKLTFFDGLQVNKEEVMASLMGNWHLVLLENND